MSRSFEGWEWDVPGNANQTHLCEHGANVLANVLAEESYICILPNDDNRWEIHVDDGNNGSCLDLRVPLLGTLMHAVALMPHEWDRNDREALKAELLKVIKAIDSSSA